jgi:hypothetical protein
MRKFSLDVVPWTEANFKERVLCSMFDMYLHFASHDEAMTVLLSTLANHMDQDEINIVIEQIEHMRETKP